MDMIYRGTFATINLDRIKGNVKRIKDRNGLPFLYAVVKANAYGHGDVQVARAALDAGATHLAVATLDEALKLRREIKDKDILVMGVIHPDDANVAYENNIDITINSLQHYKLLDASVSKSINVHIKLNTGMNRIGISDSVEFKTLCEEIFKNEKFIVKGLFTHFASSDSEDETYYEEQIEKFKQMTQSIDLSKFKLVHLSNSASQVLHNKISIQNCARLGIAMYGLEPNPDYPSKVNLEQAFSLTTTIMQIEHYPKGTKIGYSSTYTTTQDEEYIATVPIGYADGFIRRNQNRWVVINKKRYQIVGRVCMDQMMIKVDNSVSLFDKVEIMGDNIKVDEVARDLGTINYEITCLISKRVPRIYTLNDKVIEIVNDIK